MHCGPCLKVAAEDARHGSVSGVLGVAAMDLVDDCLDVQAVIDGSDSEVLGVVIAAAILQGWLPLCISALAVDLRGVQIVQPLARRAIEHGVGGMLVAPGRSQTSFLGNLPTANEGQLPARQSGPQQDVENRDTIRGSIEQSMCCHVHGLAGRQAADTYTCQCSRRCNAMVWGGVSKAATPAGLCTSICVLMTKIILC